MRKLNKKWEKGFTEEEVETYRYILANSCRTYESFFEWVDSDNGLLEYMLMYKDSVTHEYFIRYTLRERKLQKIKSKMK